MAIKKNTSPIEILEEALGDSEELEFRGIQLEAKEAPIVLDLDASSLAGGRGIPPALIAQAINQAIQHVMMRAPIIAQQALADLGLGVEK